MKMINCSVKNSIILSIVVGIIFIATAVGIYGGGKSETDTEWLIPYINDCRFTEEMTEGIRLEQTIMTSLDVIEGVYLETATFDRVNTSELQISILTDNDEEIYTERLSLLNAINNQYSYFEFSSPVDVSELHDLKIAVESVGNAGGNGICLVLSNYDTYTLGELTINGVLQEGDCFLLLEGYTYQDNVFNRIYCLGAVILLVYIITVSLIMLYKQKEMDIVSGAIRVLILLLLVCSIAKVDSNVLNNIIDRETLEYMVYINNPELKRVDENGITFSACNHANKLVSNNIMFQKCDTYTGEVIYSFYDGNELIFSDQRALSDIMHSFNSEWDEMVIDCSAANLHHGDTYLIELKFKQTNPMNIVTNDNDEVQQRQIIQFSYRYLYIGVVIFVTFVFLLAIAYILIWGFSDRVFLLSGLIIGTIMCFVLAPCSADDEYRHFLRVYDIVSDNTQMQMSDEYSNAKGNVIVESNGKAQLLEVPYELNHLRLLDMSFNYDNISYDAEMNYRGCIDETIRVAGSNYPEETTLVSLAATGQALVVAYLPQVVFAFIGRMLGCNAIGLFYLARFGNMLVALLIAYVCLKLVPEYKNLILVVYFAPSASWIRASCNRDSFVSAAAMLCIVYIMHLKINKKSILEPGRIIFLAVSFSILAMAKLPYLILAGLVLIFDENNFLGVQKRWKQITLCLALFLLFFIVGLGSYKVATYTPPQESIQTVDVSEKSVNEETHVSYALHNPIKLAKVLWERYKTIYTEDLYRSVIGYKYQFEKLYLYVVFIIILLTKRLLKFKEKIWTLVVFMVNWLAVVVVGYTFMPPDYGSIWGVNPRYMIPLLPLLAIAFSFGSEKTNKLIKDIAPAPILCMVSMDILSMITIYW